MRIPPHAQVNERKIYDYLLARHARDDKSAFLAQAGFNRATGERLRSAIVTLSTSVEAVPGQTTPYGKKWLVSGTITGPNGRNLSVRLVWIERLDDGKFHFVTLVPIIGAAP